MTEIQIIVLFILAILFFTVGIAKISQNKIKLANSMPWTREFKPVTIKFIGFLEISASFGLVGPIIIGFGNPMTPYAALGLSLIMVLAGIYHSHRKQYYSLFLNLVLLLLCLYIVFA